MFYFVYCIEVDKILPVDAVKLFLRQLGADRIQGLIERIFFRVESHQGREVIFDIEESDVLYCDHHIFVISEYQKTFLTLLQGQWVDGVYILPTKT